MTSLQKIGYASLASMLAVTQSFAALNLGKEPISSDLQGGGVGVAGIMNLIAKFLGFVTVIAVIYVIWAGFQILTAGGDEDKVKKGRTTIIQVVIGIVIMWLAYTLVSLVMGALV